MLYQPSSSPNTDTSCSVEQQIVIPSTVSATSLPLIMCSVHPHRHGCWFCHHCFRIYCDQCWCWRLWFHRRKIDAWNPTVITNNDFCTRCHWRIVQRALFCGFIVFVLFIMGAVSLSMILVFM